jgi:lipopolysaccharide transport system ATP-binding protein
MKPVIKVSGLSKSYQIGSRQQGYRTLRETLSQAVRQPLKGLRLNGQSKARIWALNEINFEVQAGEVVGIIGGNGAGKSTLLKVLSRIIEPTSGRAEMHGRVGSLLEVGTGFHPELTGRENIYLNGAILGMKRIEIQGKFDEIVAFAEVGKFIDTPVKRYSSGMFLRLAFSVAAHLEPEILIVDEVLAVGDAGFQRKCLDQMKEVSRHGRTVIFVSHNMPAIARLCPRTVLLDEGKLLEDGPSSRVISRYLKSGLRTSALRQWTDLAKAPGNDIARLLAVRVRTEENETRDAIDIRRPVGIEMEFEVLQPGHVLVPNHKFFNEEGVMVCVVIDPDPIWSRKPRPAGRYRSTAWIPGNFLAEGSVIVEAALSTFDPQMVHFDEREAVAFQVIDSRDGDSARGDYAGPMPGVVRPMLNWTTDFIPREARDSSPAI